MRADEVPGEQTLFHRKRCPIAKQQAAVVVSLLPPGTTMIAAPVFSQSIDENQPLQRIE